jgi:hypothetical protein
MNGMHPSSGLSPALRPDARCRFPVHPKAVTARTILELAGEAPVPCPHCDLHETAVTVHDHLRSDHAAGHTDVLLWLDRTDPDLFALAIHHLAELGRPLDCPV